MPSHEEVVADQLYALAPEDFTSARDALVKAEPDRAVAHDIKALRKPTVVAWALNQLVRQHRSSVEELIGLGAELRAAQEALSGDELRALGRQRHQLVRAVAGQAADLARANGRPLSPTVVDQVATSLDAALTDPSNAKRLLTGCLSAALEYAGLGEAPPALSLVQDRPAKGDAPKASTKAAERARVKALQLARAAVTTAERDLATAEMGWTRAREVLAAAHLRAGTAEERLAAARDEWEQAQAAEEAAEKVSAEAGRNEQIASLRLMQARQHADELAP